MLTGTPLDHTPFGAVLQGIGLIYWLLVIAVIALIAFKIKGAIKKTIYIGLVLALMVGPVVLHVWKRYEQSQASKAKLDVAMTRFSELCKGAGEKVYKVVADVDGILLMKLRPKHVNASNQFEMDDPYGRNCGGDDCIASYLIESTMVPNAKDPNASWTSISTRKFQFVDVIDQMTGQRYRYTKLSLTEPLRREITTAPMPAYGVTWKDISSIEDRKYWIAGGVIQVVDLKSNEIIASRTGYMLDTGQGSREGSRDPWLWASHYGKSCPNTGEHNQKFVVKILKPKQDMANRN